MIRKLGVLTMVGIVLFLAKASAEECRAVSWNLESSDSSATTIAVGIAEKGEFAFWGLSEVHNQTFLNTLEAPLEIANPGIDFVAKLSEDGGGDRLGVLCRSDQLTAIPFSSTAVIDDIADSLFEGDSNNVGATIASIWQHRISQRR